MTILEFELGLSQLRAELDELQRDGNGSPGRIERLKQRLKNETDAVFAELTDWDRVQLARHPDRPHTLDYANWCFSGFIELHGDRNFGDDPAIVGGPARLGEQSVMLIGHQKGSDARDNLARNFGMASPEGFRKARRLMLLAEKFALPVITLLDIPGASPVLEAEERGQAWAIAENLLTMAGLSTPILTIVIGEGGSGGALALGMGDRVLMQENTIYSVASPEGAASIVWRDYKFAETAAEALKLTPRHLIELGVIDGIVAEPPGGAHTDGQEAARLLRETLTAQLEELTAIPTARLLEDRHAKYRAMGVEHLRREPAAGKSGPDEDGGPGRG